MSESLSAYIFQFWLAFKEHFVQEDSLGRLIILPIFFSGLGAFSGGYAAFRFRRYEDRRKLDRLQLDTAAIAAVFCGTACNSAISFNRQFIRPIVDEYLNDRESVLRELGAPTSVKKIRLNLELITFTAPQLSGKEIVDRVQIVPNRDPRDIPQSITLLECILALQRLLDERNSWISEFKNTGSSLSEQEQMEQFYGVQDAKGHRDERYFHFMTGIKRMNDDIIFHSFEIYSRISIDLVDYGFQFKRKYGEDFHFATFDFSESVSQGFFPDRNLYADWLRAPEVLRKRWFCSGKSLLEKKKDRIRSGYANSLEAAIIKKQP